MTGSKPLPAEQLERPAHERELEQHERALQVGEARAGDARARLHVDEAAEQVEVVAARPRPPRPPRAAPRPRSGALGSGGFGTPASAAPRRSSTVAQLGLAAPSPAPRRPCISSIAAEASSPERFASAIVVVGRVLLRAQLLELRQQLAPALVELRAAHRARPRRRGEPAPRAPAPGSRRISFRSSTTGRGRVAGRSRSPPEYFSRNSATAWASSPTTMLAGMIAPGEAAVADREEHVVALDLARVEVRAVRALAARSWPSGFEP